MSSPSGVQAYPNDVDLLWSLKLSTGPFHREWTDLGTVTTYDPSEDGRSGPPTTVKVEVSAMPALFWRFTIENPADDPGEAFEVTTGSGSFRKYWPSVLLIEGGALWVKVKGEEP